MITSSDTGLAVQTVLEFFQNKGVTSLLVLLAISSTLEAIARLAGIEGLEMLPGYFLIASGDRGVVRGNRAGYGFRESRKTTSSKALRKPNLSAPLADLCGCTQKRCGGLYDLTRGAAKVLA